MKLNVHLFTAEQMDKELAIIGKRGTVPLTTEAFHPTCNGQGKSDIGISAREATLQTKNYNYCDLHGIENMVFNMIVNEESKKAKSGNKNGGMKGEESETLKR
ncbi:Hypothetical predicted protein [Octopus vulgaris]|uniref:Uncharacterized protein n=1 Tax=Octopus vulgaris TaxID=6645 RepID=A0AA36AVE7_OCTVU|nr:Hypothetical predicted protein [Octopus vulgaris]